MQQTTTSTQPTIDITTFNLELMQPDELFYELYMIHKHGRKCLAGGIIGLCSCLELPEISPQKKEDLEAAIFFAMETARLSQYETETCRQLGIDMLKLMQSLGEKIGRYAIREGLKAGNILEQMPN